MSGRPATRRQAHPKPRGAGTTRCGPYASRRAASCPTRRPVRLVHEQSRYKGLPDQNGWGRWTARRFGSASRAGRPGAPTVRRLFARETRTVSPSRTPHVLPWSPSVLFSRRLLLRFRKPVPWLDPGVLLARPLVDTCTPRVLSPTCSLTSTAPVPWGTHTPSRPFRPTPVRTLSTTHLEKVQFTLSFPRVLSRRRYLWFLYSTPARPRPLPGRHLPFVSSFQTCGPSLQVPSRCLVVARSALFLPLD